MELSAEAVSVPLGGNTYVTAGKESAKVSTDGIKSWTGTDAVLSAWFKTSQPGGFESFPERESGRRTVDCKGYFRRKSFTVKVTEAEETVIPVREGIRYGTRGISVWICRRKRKKALSLPISPNC